MALANNQVGNSDMRIGLSLIEARNVTTQNFYLSKFYFCLQETGLKGASKIGSAGNNRKIPFTRTDRVSKNEDAYNY